MQSESLEDHIGRSSLGTVSARRLRSRTSAATVDAVRGMIVSMPMPDNKQRRFTMPNPNDRYVVRNPDGGWDVKAAHAQRSSKHTRSPAEAIQRAKDIVLNAGGGEVRIQGADGRFRDSDTVASGNDPHPPKDTRH